MNASQIYTSEKVRNVDNVVINPSTEEQQTTLNNLTSALYELIQKLGFLTGARGTLADLRVTPLSTPNMSTLTTVGTLSNMSAVGGYIANPQIPGMMNNTAIQSNIINIIIT